MIPFSTQVLNWKYWAPQCPWLPIWAATLYFFSAFIISSTSWNVCANGFST